MRGHDLSVIVLQDVTVRSVKHARFSGRQRGCMLAGVDAITGGFDTDDLYFGIVQKLMKQSDRIASAADAGN